MKKTILALVLVILVGCSTIDRQTYYTASADPQLLKGPRRPTCGWTNFGGLPDSYETKLNGANISVSAYQNFHPYFWGPWFASVVPVFPITWVVEPFVSDELVVRIDGDKKSISSIGTKNVAISVSRGKDTITIEPLSVDFSSNHNMATIIFPIDYDSVETFKLLITNINQEKQNIEVVFVKTSRWAWTQLTPNC